MKGIPELLDALEDMGMDMAVLLISLIIYKNYY